MPQSQKTDWFDSNKPNWFDEVKQTEPVTEPVKQVAPQQSQFNKMMSGAPKIDINPNAPGYANAIAGVYNKLIQPMSTPLGGAMTGASVFMGPLARYAPGLVTGALRGLGIYGAATEIPHAASSMMKNGINAENSIDMLSGVAAGAGALGAKKVVSAFNKPKPGRMIDVEVRPEMTDAQIDSEFARRGAARDMVAGTPPEITPNGSITTPVQNKPVLTFKKPEPVPTELTPVQKLHEAIKQSVPLNKEQANIYSQERARRISEFENMPVTDQASANARMGALKGEMPKVKMEPLKLEQPDVDGLFADIGNHPRVIGYDSVKAHTGLTKLLSGAVPQRSELDQLTRVFGKEVVDSFVQRMPKLDRAKSFISEAVNLPRALMASMDVSAPFRQGIGMVHKKEFWTSFDDMFKSLGSDKAFRAVQESIQNKPTFKLAQDSGLQLTDLSGITSREEKFMSSWAEKIPGVKASNRAYVGFLNKLRSDAFDNLILNAEKAGLDPKNNLVLTKELAEFVNTATGRGSLGKLEKNAELLNNTLFSPRLIASRVKMLNPATYMNPNVSPIVRKEYLKSLLSIAVLGSGVVGLGVAAGGEAETDPTSSDFGKLKLGNVRLDPFGGYSQYLVGANRLIQNEQKSSTTDRSYELGSKFGLPTRLDVLGRFAESKANPVVSFVTGWLRGKDFKGQEFNVPKEVVNRFVPMMMGDLYDIWKDDPRLLPAVVPAMFGFGVQDYTER